METNDQALKDIRDRLGTGTSDQERAPLLQESLRIFSGAAKDLDDFKKKVDAWFEEAMDRVSGWYKRFTRLWLFLIGVVLVSLLNADTIAIATSLWRNAPIRTALVEQAGTVARGNQPNTDEAQELLRKLEELPLPLGWTSGGGAPEDPRIWPPSGGGERAVKILGLLMTALALSFGAPFWFDLLKKFVGIRASGAEPQPAQTGPPSGAAETPARLETSRARRKQR